jgi:glutathione S-transferase
VQEFQEVRMLPEDGRLRQAARALMRLERDVFALWCRWLFRPSNDAAERRAREAFEAAMQAVDDALGQIGGGGPFFLGEDISMVDLLFVPFMERQNASLLYWKGFKLRNGGWANIDRCVCLLCCCKELPLMPHCSEALPLQTIHDSWPVFLGSPRIANER